jgi:NAD(P)-dependent dehydrogenase (short-subunit alcohol dehydrogenase family)
VRNDHIRVGFDGRTVIVTGAGNGLGREYALELGRRGANVVVNDLGTSTAGQGASNRPADIVVGTIIESGGQAVASYDSVAEPDGCRRIAGSALDAFGRIDAVVHNAGIHGNAMFEDMSDDLWFRVLATHLFGSFYLTRTVWPTMRAQGHGRLVFISSGSGAFGRKNGANYATAKAGLLGLCNALALEGEEHGVLANAVLPVAFTRLSGAPDAHDHSAEAEAIRDARYERYPRFAPPWTVPLVTYLASDVCRVTHRYYSNAGGRYSRVFVGATHGWYPDGEEPPSAEDIAEHLEMIDDQAVFDTPQSMSEEMQLVMARHPPNKEGTSL